MLINFGPALRSEAIEEIAQTYGVNEFVTVSYPEPGPRASVMDMLDRAKAHVLDLLGGQPLQIYVPPANEGIVSKWITEQWPQASFIVMTEDRMPLALVNPAGGIQFTQPFDFVKISNQMLGQDTDGNPAPAHLDYGPDATTGTTIYPAPGFRPNQYGPDATLE